MSERDLTTAVETEIGEAQIRPVLIAELEFDAGAVRVWSGYGDLSWDSKTWSGIGTLGSVTAIEETAALEAKGVDFQLSGIPSEMISLALGETYQGRPARIWLAFLDDAGSVIADPVGPFGYLMDVADIQEGETESRIVLHAENRLRLLDDSSSRRSTDEDQKLEYPDDMGYEYVSSLQDKELKW